MGTGDKPEAVSGLGGGSGVNLPRTLDGAMGTQLIARGLKDGEPTVLWNVTRAEDVCAVHAAYVAAGAEAVTTNTFAGNLPTLERYGLADRFEELNRAAYRLAREAAGARWVLGDIGPSGDFLEPMGDLTEEGLAEFVGRQAEALEGVDAYLVETMSDPGEVAATVRCLVKYGKPVFATFTYEPGARGLQTMMGTTPAAAVRAAVDAGASVVGANCGSSLDLETYLELGRALLGAAGSTPVMLQPNAGAPIPDGDGFRYAVGPDEYGAWAKRARELGIAIVGGCCGTSPAHIGAAGL